MNTEIAVIDYECMTSVGSNLTESWRNLVNNCSGIRLIDRYDPNRVSLQRMTRVAYGGQIPLTFERLAGSEERLLKWREPNFHAVQAVTKALLERMRFRISEHDPQRIAFLGGTSAGPQFSRDSMAESGSEDPKYILNLCTNIPLSEAASVFGIMGPSFNIASACASSGHAILMACWMLKADLLDCVLVVGHDFPLAPYVVGGFDWLNALYRRNKSSDRGYEDPTKACRPFSLDRRGFVLGEGVGLIFISRLDYARKMGWSVKGMIRGGYTNSDAGHLTRSSVENMARCMCEAIKAARSRAEEIDCVNAHSTSTKIGDSNELKALSEVFADRLKNTPVVANKSQLGHTLGAASALALIFTLEGMNRNILLPTLNHLSDPSLPEALICSETTERHHRLALINSLGFGGTNVSLVVERRPE